MKQSDNKDSGKKRNSEYEEKLHINGSLDDVLMASFQKGKGEWRFKSGMPLPKLDPDNYIVANINCNTGNINDILLRYIYYIGDKKFDNPINTQIEGAKTFAALAFPLRIKNSNGAEFILELKNNKADYDFVISYIKI